MFTEQMNSTTDTYIGAACDKVKARGWPTDRFIIGAINEYGGATNAEWKPHRFRTNGIVRNKLPLHTIVEGPCNWKGAQSLFDPESPPYNGAPKPGVYEPWSDANTIQDVHHYYGWDLPGMTWLADQLVKWSADNKRVVYSGEWGFDQLDQWKDQEHIKRWVGRFEEESKQLSIAKVRPTLWAITDGNDWRMNDHDGNTIRAEMAPSMKPWAQRIDKLLGYVA